MPLEGHATVEGSREFCEQAVRKGANPEHFRDFDSLKLSSLGIGTYLGETNAETDNLVTDAVYKSVSSGAVNVIDTAINYRLQKAERSVGRAIAKMMEDGVARREGLFICSKNGYLTSDGDSVVDFWNYIHRELIKPGKLKPDEIASEVHSMAVPYLRDQFQRSLSNMGLQSLDLLYLHNAAESWLEEIGYRRFLERLEGAFSYYEEERRKGRLLYYGLATWSCLRGPKGDPQHVNLDDLVEIAKNSGGEDHGFRFIQLPFNVSMNEALVLKNQRIADEPLTTFEAAQKLGLGVFTSVPLGQGRLLNHPRVPQVDSSRSLSLLQFARSAHTAVVAPLVGQKDPSHIEENLKLASLAPLKEEEFEKFYGTLIHGDEA